MHSHFSALAAINAFLAVVIVGSFWRLTALHLAASDNPGAKNVGLAMSFQY